MDRVANELIQKYQNATCEAPKSERQSEMVQLLHDEWMKGSHVFLLRSPDWRTWGMQAYTNLVDKAVTDRRACSVR